jgi:hypothetical protein
MISLHCLLQVDAAAVRQADRHFREVLLELTMRFQNSTTTSETAAAAAAAAAWPSSGYDSSSSGHASMLSVSQVRLWLSLTGSSIKVTTFEPSHNMQSKRGAEIVCSWAMLSQHGMLVPPTMQCRPKALALHISR